MLTLTPTGQAILHTILAQEERQLNQAEIGLIAAAGKRTVTKLVSQLKAERVLADGRPTKFGPGLGLVLGISLGMENLRAGIVDASGVVHHQIERAPSGGQLSLEPALLLDRVRQIGIEVLQEALGDEQLWSRSAVRSLPLLGVAVAWPLPVDRDGRPWGAILDHAAWMHSRGTRRERIPLPERMAEAFAPVFPVDRCHALNGANAHALAVAFDQSRERAGEAGDDQWRVAFIVRIGGSIGGATFTHGPHRPARLSFIDARLISGTNGFAGELAHLPVSEAEIEKLNQENTADELIPLDYVNARCCCRRPGHLDAFASGRALIERLECSGYSFPHDIGEKAKVIKSALRGEVDEVQKQALEDVGRVLGCSLAAPILMLDPHRVTLTGSLATKAVRDGVIDERQAWRNAIGDTVAVDFVDGERGAYLGVRGAALAVIRRSVYRGFMDSGSWPSPVDFGFADLERLRTSAEAPLAN